MGDPLLEVEDLTVRYETDSGMLTAVSDASFTVEEGEFFGLAGESGSGKSTLAKAVIGGLDDNGEIVSGTLRYRGEEIQGLSDKELNRRLRWKEISWIPQSSMNSLDPLQRVSEQALEIGRVHTDLSDETLRTKLEDMFDIVGLQQSRIDDYPHQFSGGMQQRAIIALALFLEPSLVIADEPTTALDVIMQDQIFKYLDRTKEETDTSLLLITHDISVIFESCDSVAIMHASQVAERGSTTAVQDNPRHPYAFMFKEAFPDIREPKRDLEVIEGYPPELMGDVDFCSFADRCPWAVEECRQGAPATEDVGDDPGHAAACVRADEAYELYRAEQTAGAEPAPDEAPASSGSLDTSGTAGAGESDGPPLLELRNLEKYFEESRNVLDVLRRRDPSPVQAVDDVSLTLRENESTAVIGESGCGKTTLLLTLIGLHDPTGGDVYYRGTPFSEFDKSDWKEYRRNVQVIFQDPFNSLDPKMTVEESMKEPLKIHGIGNRDERVREVLRDVELSPPEQYLSRKPANLSGGEKQRVAIGRALVLDPDIILADEPVSMLDVSTQAAVLNMLKGLIDDYGASMIYISHDLSTVSYISETVNVMYLGRIVESARTEPILSDPKHPYTQALVSAIPVPDAHYGRERTEMSGAPRDPVGLGEGCRFRDRCPSVIPPDDVEIDQRAFRELTAFREQLARGDLSLDRIRATVEDGDEAALAAAIEDEYFEHDLSGRNATVRDEALSALAAGDREAALAGLRERFESVCERTPSSLGVEDDWTVACHLHDEAAAERGGENAPTTD